MAIPTRTSTCWRHYISLLTNSSRAGQKSEIFRVFNYFWSRKTTIFGPETKQPMGTYLRLKQSEQIPQGRKIQNGDTGNDKDVPPDRGVGHVHRFQGRLLPYTHTKPVKKIPAFSLPWSNIPVQSTTIWSVHCTHRVHSSGQRGQTDGIAQGYNDPPRRLFGQSQIPPNPSLAHTDSSSYMSGVRFVGKHGEITTGPQTSFQLHRLPVRPEGGQGQTHPRVLEDPDSRDPRFTGQTNLCPS